MMKNRNGFHFSTYSMHPSILFSVPFLEVFFARMYIMVFLYRWQEELAEGLHLIDFEQLKIENQTYNEKIEERNEVRYST